MVCFVMWQKADLLSFPTHSAFILDMRMAKDPERVASFLSDLRTKLVPLKEEEMRLFLEYKREDVSSVCLSVKNNHWKHHQTAVVEA